MQMRRRMKHPALTGPSLEVRRRLAAGPAPSLPLTGEGELEGGCPAYATI